MRNASKIPAPPASSPLRVAVYARVSTVRQAEADLSIPDQIRQAELWCQRQVHEIVRQYIEPGASGTDDTRWGGRPCLTAPMCQTVSGTN